MSELLHTTRAKALGKKGARPLLVEFPTGGNVAPPYLVSSTKGLCWIYRQHHATDGATPIIKAAVRPCADTGALLWEVVLWAVTHSKQSFPLSEQGFKQAVAALALHSPTLDVLVQDAASIPWVQRSPTLGVGAAPWVPPKCLVLVPRDRASVGTLVQVDDKNIALSVRLPASIALLGYTAP